MASAGKMNGSENGGNGSHATEPSLADGTGQGNAPIKGSSASSDPNVLAGTTGDATAASLNDDDDPENIAEAVDAVDVTSGQQTPPDEAAGVDSKGGAAIPDRTARNSARHRLQCCPGPAVGLNRQLSPSSPSRPASPGSRVPGTAHRRAPPACRPAKRLPSTAHRLMRQHGKKFILSTVGLVQLFLRKLPRSDITR